MEIWKDIKGYEGLYQVSNLGNIRDSKRNKPRKVSKNCRGYGWVHLTKDKASKPFSAHRLVAIHFIPNPDNLPQVNHRNLNKMDNRVENLEWCDNSYNTSHSYQTREALTGDKGGMKLSDNPNAKKVIHEESGKTYPCASEAAIDLGIKPKYFQRMLRGVLPNNTGFKYL